MASFAVRLYSYGYCSAGRVVVWLFNIVLVCVGMVVCMHVAAGAEDDDGPPVLFIFGDSTADVGTNNLIPTTLAKADFPFNGIDFAFSIPTGRFSNGFNTADYIARLLGHKRSPPPFLALEQRLFSFKKNILQGANFASAGSGILRETGHHRWGDVVYLEKQVEQFERLRGNITEVLGPAQAHRFVANALFLISVGSNDIFEYVLGLNNITLPNDEFIPFLTLTYTLRIQKLYDMGARKFGIVSVPPVGCCPAARARKYEITRKKGGCDSQINDLARAFFSELHFLLQSMTATPHFKAMNYSLGNTFAMTINMLEDPLVFGLKETERACCGNGNFNGEIPCYKMNGTNLCGNRKDHLFWDWFHPTAKVSELAALSLYGAAPKLVTPINFRQLAAPSYYY